MNFVNLIKKAVSATLRANPLLVLLYVAFFGAMIILGSFVQEIWYQQNLMATQGYDALLAYQSLVHSHQVGLIDYIVPAIYGHMPAVSAQVRGVGYAVFIVGSPASAIFVAFDQVLRRAILVPLTEEVV